MQGLIYNPTYTESGAELGFYFDDFAFLTVSAGRPVGGPLFQDDPVYTANLKIQPTIGDEAALFLGGSFATFRRRAGMPKVNMYGGYAGLGFGDFTIMGEFDIADDFIEQDSTSTAMMVEVAYRVIKGLEAVVRLDRFDPNSDFRSDESTRVVVGLEIFPFSFIEIRPQYRIQMEDPSIENDSALIQLHIWY